MSPEEVDTVLAVALAADLAVEPCDVEVPWYWQEDVDPEDATLKGHVSAEGKVTEMRIELVGGRTLRVPADLEAMARCDLRDAAIELWGRR